MERLIVFLEALARLVVSAEPKQAIKIFKWGCQTAQLDRIKHFWLSRSFSNLIEYSLLSIPNDQHSIIFKDILSFPLATELKVNNDFVNNWPNPIASAIPSRQPDFLIDSRINEIIDNVSAKNKDSVYALLRLFPILEAHYLKPEELKKLQEKIWGYTPNYHCIPDLGVLPHTLLELPNDNQNALRSSIRQHLFESNELYDIPTLIAIRNLVLKKESPTYQQANKMFNTLTSWRFTPKRKDIPEFFNDNNEQRVSKEIGLTLNEAIIPHLEESKLDKASLNKLLRYYEETQTFEVLSSFVYFSKKFDESSNLLERSITEGLYTQNSRRIVASSSALFKWCEFNFSVRLKLLITKLIYAINPSQTTGLASLINTANKLYYSNYLSGLNISTLKEIVPIIYDVTGYENIDQSSRLAISVTLVREACVKLARELLMNDPNSELQRVIDEAKTDPLPEVRFA